MKATTRRTFRVLFAAASLVAAQACAEWPEKAITLVVPGGTGGVADIRARWLAPRLSTVLGQPVIVENKPGAGGNVGTAAAAKAAPDGYTLLMVHQGTMSVNPHLSANTGYSPLRDFVPITRMGHGSLALVVNPRIAARTVPELVAEMKARGNAGLNYGSPGVGTPPHLASELFKLRTGTLATHVPYKSGGQAASDLIAGHVDFAIEGLQVMAPLIKDGRVRVLAVSGPRRAAALPDVPTISEAGVTGYSYEGWTGIAAPAGTPKAVIDKAYAAIRKVITSDEGREFFARAGAEPGAEPPEAFAELIREESERLGRVVREAGIKAE